MGILTSLRNLFRRKPKTVAKKPVARPPVARATRSQRPSRPHGHRNRHHVLNDHDEFEEDENLAAVVSAAFNSDHGVMGEVDESGELHMTELCPEPDLSVNETCYEPEQYRRPEPEPERYQAPEPVRESYSAPEPSPSYSSSSDDSGGSSDDY